MGMLLGCRRALLGIGQDAAANWWEAAGVAPWAAYQPKGAASFAASLTDLTGNGRDAGDPGGGATPGWGAVTGWTFDGIAQYLTTTFVPGVALTQNQSMLIQFTALNASTGVDKLSGVIRSGVNIFGIGEQVGASTIYYNGQTVGTGAPPVAGNLAVAGAQGYRNGAADGGLIGGWSLANGQPIYIGAENNAGVAQFFASYHCTALILYDVTLTAPQVALIAAAIAAL